MTNQNIKEFQVDMITEENNQTVDIEGMCATTTAVTTRDDEPKAYCIVQGMFSEKLNEDSNIRLNLPSSTTAEQLIEEVSRRFQVDSNSLHLTLDDKQDNFLRYHADETLEELGFQLGGSMNILFARKRKESKKNEVSDNSDDAESQVQVDETSSERTVLKDRDSQTICGHKKSLEWIDHSRISRYKKSFEGGDASSSYTYVPLPAPPPYNSGGSGGSDFSYNYTYSQALMRQETGFVGLVNQAMTCYLNSLLQTLFMTPEFRNTLYRWEFDGTEEEGTKSIPFQLQKLFLQLQTSNKPAVGTTELTTSFGWDSSEAWQQHDVQELCRVMFDALEQKFKNTQQADLISRLYEGKLKDYVKCLECSYESAREDTFLDVPLVVRPFGSSQAYVSVEEALHAFVTPETLQTGNQYFCEHCNKKCDAHKGLKFTKFPYLLTLQLKRFDFDYVTMHRIKLNDRVSFPEVLNLNEFVKTENCSDSCDDADTTDSGSALDDDSASFATGYKTGSSLSPEAISDNIDLADDDEGIDVGPQGSPLENCAELPINDKAPKKPQAKGPYMYELFSIMVHSGSANGGHYYAYIKSFKDGEWYCFNDAQVTRITIDDIQKTYGGGPSRGYYSSAYSSSTNAYMLMYRQIDKEKNAESIEPESFPEHIKVLLQCMQAQEERERQQREMDRLMCKIKLFCQHPVQRRMIDMKLKVHRDDTLSTATAVAHKILNLEGVVPLECCRLVKYDDFLDSLESSFDTTYDEPMGELLGGVKSSYKFDLLLEIRKPHEQFQEYKPGGTTIKVHVIDLEREDVAAQPITIRSDPTDTVEKLGSQIAQSLGVSGYKMRIVLEGYSNETKLLDDPLRTLSSEGFKRSNKVFVEFKDCVDADKSYEDSKLFKVLDRYAHTILIHVALPKVDKGILEKLRIQDNDPDERSNDSSSEEESGDSTTEMNDNPHDIGKEKCIARLKNQISEAANEMKKILDLNNESLVKNKFSLTPDDPSQDYDEGLGDSEIGDSSSTNGCQGGQAIHSDQSEDSSLTDSERTLIGDELSPRNISPDVMGTEIEQDLQQPAGVEVSKPECDSVITSSDSSGYLLNRSSEDCRNMSSPEENTKDTKCCSHSVCKDVCLFIYSKYDSKYVSDNTETVVVEENVNYYFRSWPYTDYETGEKMLRVYVDKRITLGGMKKELEPIIGVGADCFKIYRVYSNNQEVECTRVAENLMTYGDDTKLTIKLGRALRKGEYKVQIYQLCINEPETSKHLIDWVLLKGMTVLKAKKEILAEVKERCSLDIPLNRCRLRKKSWKNPGTIYLDHQRFDKDISLTTHSEMFFEVLSDAEPLTDIEQTALYTRRWHPSKFTLDPFQEIVLDSLAVIILKKKLSEISDIPSENIQFAKGRGTFPCEVSLLTIHTELEWQNDHLTQSVWPLCIGDDGHVIYYRDMTEELKILSDEEKREITNKENARSKKNQKSSCSPRKEKALKIYTLDTPSSSSTNNSATNTTENTQSSVQDMDSFFNN